MALLNINMSSQYLKGNEEVIVILPDRPRKEEASVFYGSKEKYRVLWLLHGGYGSCSDWIRKSRIEIYACEHDLAVVMPSAMNSMYSSWPDYATGYDMYGFLTEELMPMIYGWLPISRERNDNFIAGLSMGGGGAFKYALTHPDRFAGAAVLSWAPYNYREDEKEKLITPGIICNLAKACGGGKEFLESADNLWDLAEKAAESSNLPRLYFSIGEEDFLFGTYKKFVSHAKEAGLSIRFSQSVGYGHEWRFWDMEIPKVLEWFGFEAGERGNRF
ncbi:alpha/beta hydrolase [Hungatella hathewayi]